MPHIDLWRILLCAVLILIVVMRANIMAFIAKFVYGRNPEKGLKLFKIADKIGNLSVNNKQTLGYILLRNGYPEDAEVNFRQILPRTKHDSPARYKLKNMIALSLWKRGHLDDAIEELEEVMESSFRHTMVYQNLGILYNLSDDKEKALKYNLEAYEYNSDDNIICDNLADIYIQTGQLDKAKEIYEKMMAGDKKPGFPEAYYGYGKLLIELGEKEKGLDMMREALDKTFSYLSIKSKAEVEEMIKSYE